MQPVASFAIIALTLYSAVQLSSLVAAKQYKSLTAENAKSLEKG